MVRKGLFTWKVLGLEFTLYEGCPCCSSSIYEDEEQTCLVIWVRKASHRLRYLSAWSVSGTVWAELQGVAVLEENYHSEWASRFKKNPYQANVADSQPPACASGYKLSATGPNAVSNSCHSSHHGDQRLAIGNCEQAPKEILSFKSGLSDGVSSLQ